MSMIIYYYYSHMILMQHFIKRHGNSESVLVQGREPVCHVGKSSKLPHERLQFVPDHCVVAAVCDEQDAFRPLEERLALIELVLGRIQKRQNSQLIFKFGEIITLMLKRPQRQFMASYLSPTAFINYVALRYTTAHSVQV